MRGLPTAFWGKFRRGEEDCSWHPLEDHCADVAACLEAMLAMPNIRRRLARSGGADDLDTVQVQRLCYLTYLHDVGKLNLGFQSKIFPERRFSAGHVREALLLFRDPLRPRFVDVARWVTVADWAEDEAVFELLLAAISHHGSPVNFQEPLTTVDPAVWQPQFSLDPVGASRFLSRAPATLSQKLLFRARLLCLRPLLSSTRLPVW